MPEVKILNNLVAELLSVTVTQSTDYREYKFVNPREGWVFVSSSAGVSGPGRVLISLDPGAAQDILVAREGSGEGQTMEAMRYLPAGEHTVAVSQEGKSVLKSLTVRAIPEIIYCQFQYDPHVTECGPYDWDFLRRYILPNINTMVGSGAPKHRPYIEKWKKQGKKWIIECGVPGLKEENISPDEAYDAWIENVGFQDPLLDGVIADEFSFANKDQQYRAWTEAVRRICQDERFKGKVFYPYCGAMYKADPSRKFIETIMSCGYKFAWERYLKEQPTEEAAREFLNSELRDECLEWRSRIPGSEKHMIVCLGYLSGPPESLNTNPGVDWKVYMDMQFNMLANDPAFQGICGVMEYTSGYAEEEIIRWQGGLYRHYCIEGKREMLSDDPYILSHIVNPDFDEGTRGWTLKPAEEGSMGTKHMDGYSWLQGRYPKTEEGNNFLWTRRSAKGPNIFSQEIRGLKPGRLYSLKMFTADYRDLVEGRSLRQKHAVSIKLDDAEIVRSFQHVYPNCYDHHLGPFNDKHRFWINYHFVVFRPKSSTGRIEVSDWAEPGEPGGPLGQELIYNFIEIQPYLEE